MVGRARDDGHGGRAEGSRIMRLLAFSVVMGLLAALLTVLVPTLRVEPANAAADGCSYATGGTAAYTDTICWIDFSSYNEAEARSAAGQDFELEIDGGYTARFNLTSRPVAGYPYAATAPYPAPLRNNVDGFGTAPNYTGIAGRPVLWNIVGGVGASGVEWTLNDIDVVGPDGNSVEGFRFVSGDAEFTSNGESVQFQSDVPLQLIAALNQQPGKTGCKVPNTTGIGTTSVLCTGSGVGGANATTAPSANLIFGSIDPTFIRQTVRSSSRNAGVFGFMMSKVSLTKTVTERRTATDDFDVIVRSGSSTIASANTGQGSTATTGEITVPSNSTLTLDDTASGTTDLSQYEPSWSCTRNGVVDPDIVPSDDDPYRVVIDPSMTGVGDIVECAVENTPKKRDVKIAKTSDAQPDAKPGDVITYEVTATNTGDADYTDVAPLVVADDLSAVLPGATYGADAAPDRAGAIAFDEPVLTWTGALPMGESVTLRYSVELTAGGLKKLRNVAWAPPSEDPDDPGTTPACDPPTGGTDPATGIPCAEVEIELPSLSIEKSADRTDLPAVGESVEYTVNITNDGPGDYTVDNPATFSDDLADVLDDATLDPDSIAASVGDASFAGSTLSWSGVLAAGESAEVTYRAVYTGDGDRVLRNVACVPESEIVSPNAACAPVDVPAGHLTDWKTAAGSSDPLVAGSTIDYTLFFQNEGQASASVDRVDDLTHVLDDADVTVEPSSADGLTVTRTGSRISVTGSVPPGETYSVTYTVTVRPDGSRGDNVVANYLVGPGVPPPPPTECEPTDEQEPDCTVNLVPELVYDKSVVASSDPIAAGTELTYTVTVENVGTAPGTVARIDDLSGVIDDADVTGAPAVAGASTVTASPVVDGIITLGGELAAGESATITYTVIVKPDAERGDNRAVNFVLTPGEEPPTECDPEVDVCTVTDLPHVVPSKSVDPSSGTPVAAGEVLTYTLTFVNDGDATGLVDHTDHLARVLDDADVTGQPTSSSPDVTAVLDGETIAVSGPIAAGATVTVTYQVTVKADGDRGDNRLGNFLVVDGDEPPTECVEVSVLCTENPVGELHDWKTVEASETPVRAGTELTYTLHFENRGEGAIDVDRVDDLSLVLDDADVTVEPSSDTLTVVRNGARIGITGSLDAGQSATVTYVVTLKADGERGDDIAANFLLDPEDTPPTDPVCEPTDAEEPDCTITPIGKLTTTKSVEASSDPIVAGTTLTYTLSFINDTATDVSVDKIDDLSGVLDDATVTAQPVASDASITASEVLDGAITITGVVAAGETVTVTYTVTVNAEDARSDDTADNFLLSPGEDPPAECVEGDPNCTSTPLPNVDAAKSVDPASGSSVAAGDVLTYTLTFTNEGNATGAVDYIDYLADILDDAVVTGGPTSSDTGVTPTLDGETMAITGTIAAGATVTVVYEVTVGADGERGDNRLGNFLVPDGPEVPPTECVEGSTLCTENPIGELHDWKTVEASATPVAAGTELTYTLHFENRGEGAIDVDRVDFLTHVLDDADVTAEPVSDVLTATRNGEAITISGTLAPGESTTVVYTVTVKADGERGDSIAANFLVPNLPDVPPPAEPICQPTDAEEPDCTVTPIGQLTTGKSVEASSDPIVPGTTLTYTLTFDNQSEAPVTVDHIDDLSSVLDDADVTSLPVVSDPALTVSPIIDGVLSISGEVAPGQTVTVTYVVTVKEEAERGDDVATNFLVENGVVPPSECVEGDPNCTSTPLPNVTAVKSVDPASGTSVAAGDVLSYTLTFTNGGNATGAVDYTDHLADILDDGTITGTPESSDAAVSAVVDGESIAVTGEITAGATVTVTYEVTVGADGARGDNHLGNFLVPGDEEPPTECVEGSALCTENPIGELHDWKTVEASTTPVAAGTELTYTLHFENRGEGSIDVNTIDFLTHVLDDADVTTEPTSDDLTAVRAGEAITITGSLEPGQSATVTYTVTVKADGARGDDTAFNFLVKNDPEDPPVPPTDPSCEPTDSEEPDCTTTLIGSYTAVKTVTPNETPIGVGTLLAYTLTFTNASESAAEVDETDTLTDVLDDATLVDAPASSSDALTASAVTDGAFRITGTLEPGQTVTVVYTVSVNPESQRGDNLAANTLLPTDGDQECTPERCTETPIPTIVPEKSVSPTEGSTVREGDFVTYTLTFTNTSAVDGSIEYTDDLTGVLDDGAVTSQPTSSSPTGSATLDGTTITVIGTVPAGESVTVVYQVTVLPDGERGDNVMGNVLVPEGEDPPVPGEECEEGDPLCTVTYVGELHDWKTVEESARPVAAGTELTYTLHFENRGEGVVDVDAIDFLTHVLDDADVTGEPISAALTATRNGEIIRITGSLAAGESATVTYTVTVREDDQRGDDTASNFLVPNDPEEPPTPPTTPVCQPSDLEEPDCTVTPIGRLDTSKAVSASSDPIESGTTLTYTLTFDNQSEAAVTVDKVDDLSSVLDDATITSEPVPSDGALTATRDGATISVSGSLAPGQTVIVVYVVTVKDESERGDNVASNFLLAPGEVPPTECAEDDADCTVTPLPNIDSAKSVNPASGSTVLPGDVLTYTLTLTNSGEAAGAVHRIDYLNAVLDDAEFTGGPTVSDPSVTAVLDGTELVIGGRLDPDQTVTITYTLTVRPDAERGDDTLTNFLFDTEEPPPGPGTECEDGDCTENYVPRIVDSKSADPASGTPIAAGQKVTYTLHFRNDGAATGDVSKDDVLTGVLDDADLTGAPTVSNAALEVSGPTDGRIHIAGSLEPGESATVTYSVTVRPFAEQGDHVLGNWLVLPGDPPGEVGSCEPVAGEDADCTVHPIGQIAATKSVDPTTGTDVRQGQVLDYTLTFRNTGTGAAVVDYTDHLGDVLDDATLTRGPSSDIPSLELDLTDDSLTIGGTLAAGVTATVTYSVTVMAYDRQGDHVLDNFLGLSGGEPEEQCVSDNPLCTSNPTIAPPPLAITGGELGLGALALVILLILGGALAVEVARRRRLALEGAHPGPNAPMS